MQQMASSNGTLSASKSSLVISDPIPGAKPLPVPPELAPFVGVSIPGMGGPPPLCRSPCWARGAPHTVLTRAGLSCNPAPLLPLSTAALCPGQRAHHERRLGPGWRGLRPLG